MRCTICVLLTIIFSITCVSCTNATQPVNTEPSSSTTSPAHDDTQPSKMFEIEKEYYEPERHTWSNSQIKEMQNCRLIVNGKDITEDNYIVINTTPRKDAEVPLLAISEELGADVTWENEETVKITYNGEYIRLDVSQWDLDIVSPPGNSAIRMIVNNELIYDSTSVYLLLRNLMNAFITVDYENMIVYVNYFNE